MMKVIHLEDAQLSPDGRHVACVLAEADFQSNAYRLSLWEIDVVTRKRRALSKGPVALSPRWSPDGKYLAFLKRSSARTSICILAAGTGEVNQRFDVPRKTRSLAWSPAGTLIAFLAPDLRLKSEAVSKRFVGARVEGLDLERSQVFLLDRELGKYRQLSRQDGHVAHFDWSPDGSQIVLAQQPTSRPNDEWRTDLYLLDVGTGRTSPLLQRPGADSRPRYSPDGRQVAFVSQDGKNSWLAPSRICVMPITGGKPRVVSGALDESLGSRSPDSITWSPDGKALYFPAEVGVTRQVYRVDLGTLKTEAVTEGQCVHRTLSFSKDGKRMAFAIDRPSMPADLYTSPVSGYRPQPLTALNPHLRDRALGAVSVVRWKSKDGTLVEGLLVKPANYKGGAPVPLVTYLHGGPCGGFLLGFSPEVRTAPQVAFCPVQVLAGRGYAVLCPNPRGSDGYGQAFRAAVIGNWGERDVEDVLSGVDELVRSGLAAPRRLAVTGYCYGGYLALRTLTRSDRFQAACLGACFGDLSAAAGQTDLPALFDAYFGGVPWERRAVYERCSPMPEAHKVRTPVLMFHAERDQRVPWTQSKQLYTILRKVGTPAELITYPRGGHMPFEPRMHAETMRQTVLWYDRWLK
jgi:dipeptidyl aminopeptidase/acylaminoacyl peptidase